uniref:hypothetical protein n=1 Tax=Polaromonas sp. W11N TaxID=1840303 RepID=UPI0015E7F832|nr:hypothetical protein [Polaromonas sp. W11N]
MSGMIFGDPALGNRVGQRRRLSHSGPQMIDYPPPALRLIMGFMLIDSRSLLETFKLAGMVGRDR